MEIHIQDCHRYMFAAILDILGFYCVVSCFVCVIRENGFVYRIP